MTSTVPSCRTITVLGFRGDRSRTFTSAFLKALGDEKAGRGPGPTPLACLLFTGHAGVSTDGGAPIYAFNPAGSGIMLGQLLNRLKNGAAFPGVVREDSGVFSAARNLGLPIWPFEVILPEPQFLEFERRLDAERKNSQYSYGFPNGDGDCNCITWLERLGLPLLTGRMGEFIGLPGMISHPRRRFGACV